MVERSELHRKIPQMNMNSGAGSSWAGLKQMSSVAAKTGSCKRYKKQAAWGLWTRVENETWSDLSEV